MVEQWLFLLLAMLVLGIWLDALRQREHALQVARRLSRARGIQLLDETVGLAGLRLRRGRLPYLERHYAFEVSLDGNDRRSGHLWMAHGQMSGASLPDIADTTPPDSGPAPTTASAVVDLQAHRRHRRLS